MVMWLCGQKALKVIILSSFVAKDILVVMFLVCLKISQNHVIIRLLVVMGKRLSRQVIMWSRATKWPKGEVTLYVDAPNNKAPAWQVLWP